MIPASFDESNDMLSRPDCMTAEQCEPLSVLRCFNAEGFPVVISCWKLTQEELDEINRTGRVWLVVFGESMPPVMVDGIKPIKTAGDA